MVRTAAAQLPEPPHGADRVIVTRNTVIVLDGASAFEPAGVPPGEYASHLGASIAAALAVALEAPLASVLGEAITTTAAELGLDDDAGCPSSTVAMARLAGNALDLLALGDSYIFYGTGTGGTGTGTLTDDRLAGGAGGQTAEPLYGTPTPGSKGVELPTSNRYGPPGTSGFDPTGGAGSADIARSLMDTGQSVSKSLADDPSLRKASELAPGLPSQ